MWSWSTKECVDDPSWECYNIEKGKMWDHTTKKCIPNPWKACIAEKKMYSWATKKCVAPDDHAKC